ncbi:APC1-C domain-containing protein [Mycena indigotica]|uniref:APC1-C domain-containing protein n=1 Tax=Mycena indigotica TaxID=2126181 RepID=A0A8H6SE59_9AGAR|nr:APC1-C domain-containing protein [Mycena indigotica]KAF7297086.1 APC1-C domain-containing protein [Mycena indigotica]
MMSKSCTISVVLSDETSATKNRHLFPTRADAEWPKNTLLSTIRGALHGSPIELAERRRASLVDDDSEEEEEILWDSSVVVWRSGGIIRKTWSFIHEGEQVQTATIGWLDHSTDPSPSTTLSNATDPSSAATSERPTFGPFARYQQTKHQPSQDQSTREVAIFVFLRSVGKIFLKTGHDYTFSLPFVVHKVWPLYPHGAMIQRHIEPAEVADFALTGESLLPTIFSLTSPFAEPCIVGLTSGILGDSSIDQATLKDEDENSKKPVKAIPSGQKLVWASNRASSGTCDVIVTIDTETRQLCIWRYVYIKPKDTPVPLGRARVARHRQSMSTNTTRRSSAVISSLDRIPLRSPKPSSVPPTAPVSSFPVLPSDMPPLSSLPGMPPALSTTTTMSSITLETSSQWSAPLRTRRNTLTRNELSVTMDRMALGAHTELESSLIPLEHARMKTCYWAEKLLTYDAVTDDCDQWQMISCTLFDGRRIGASRIALLSVHLPISNKLLIFEVSEQDNHFKVHLIHRLSALAAVTARVTRANVWDLLVLRPDHQLTVLTHGTKELLIQLRVKHAQQSNLSFDVVGLRPHSSQSVSLVFKDDNLQQHEHHLSLNLIPTDYLTHQTLQILALTIPADIFFELHQNFLSSWSSRALLGTEDIQFQCLVDALTLTFDLSSFSQTTTTENAWSALAKSSSHYRFREEECWRHLKTPNRPLNSITQSHHQTPRKYLLAPILYALHSMAEDLRLRIDRYNDLCRVAPIICKIALAVRPEWADYWKRLCPNAMAGWPRPSTEDYQVDDRLPVWPPDVSAILYGRISNPEWPVPWHDTQHIANRFHLQPSFAFGHMDPLTTLTKLTAVYKLLALPDTEEPFSHKRAEKANLQMVQLKMGPDFLDRLPLGVLSPIREAMRTCQVAPPGDWTIDAYRAVGRNDVAASASNTPEMLFTDGYKSPKQFVTTFSDRPTVQDIIAQAKVVLTGEDDVVSGVELDLDEFTNIRFGQDRRIDEVARLLCSSNIPSVKVVERVDLNEHDQTKEQQQQVLRIAERTLALPYGRAMFTFGSLLSVSKEAYTIPKMEFTVRLQPMNITVSPEAGKLPPESMSWGDFHNGVAAGLRVSPTALGVESSWIAFNKPSELTPEHAGFLFGLGLAGHLKQMLTWHTFSYLTPKHDLTSMGVLLGLAAANVGTGEKHVTKLLAVHTPALLPTPTVDLNVPLMTQAAGLSGIGLLYMGTRNRRMAEVCLGQISRHDLAQPDLSNEYREAYTFSAALAFGMIMLGKGSSIPADATFLDRLTVLIHGELHTKQTPGFDINLTSPAASLALGLMYLRTERQDIADMLTIPETILALNRIQPSFLLNRVLAKALIMWDAVAPTPEWQAAQIPRTIREAVDARTKSQQPIDDAIELAYYNILAASCFVIGLKFAGTARQEAYMMIIRHFDVFTRLVYTNSQAFDQKIRRSAVRDGLNLISIALSMVMAGTGEISCLRRLRFAYGMYTSSMYHPSFKYGTHVATHMSLGLLFLGGGRFTLGTSDAAIASMVTAFFPRAHHLSSDNKSFLQALRHLWVMAVEPRCLIARDVETGEVVYLPVKVSVNDGQDTGTTQLISPTLIPDLDKLAAIRVDTPRYWPFHFDTANISRHRNSLLRSQTLYVKRRTAFLSYTEDPRGSRSLFVRSRTSTGEAATLDFPRLSETKIHPAGDLSEFITSFSNDVLFLAFADHMARDMGATDGERLLHAYSHANLLDSILQGKPQTLQSHLTLFRYRIMPPTSRYFQLNLQDLRFASDFYNKIYERRFSGRKENNHRIPLIRDGTVSGALYALDKELDLIRIQPQFLAALGRYSRGEEIEENVSQTLAWYMLRNSVPVSTLLVILKDLARESYQRCLDMSDGSTLLEQGIKEVLHATGTKLTTALGAGWSMRSLNEIVSEWIVHVES